MGEEPLSEVRHRDVIGPERAVFFPERMDAPDEDSHGSLVNVFEPRQGVTYVSRTVLYDQITVGIRLDQDRMSEIHLLSLGGDETVRAVLTFALCLSRDDNRSAEQKEQREDQ